MFSDFNIVLYVSDYLFPNISILVKKDKIIPNSSSKLIKKKTLSKT